MTETQPAEEHTRPEIQALALAALKKQIGQVDPVVRAMFSQDYGNGESKTFRAPDGRKLGQVRRNDPDPEWKITDRAKLREHLAGQGAVEGTVYVSDEDWPEALAVLQAHAPGLLSERAEVPDSALTAALADAKRGGDPAPGVELVDVEGSLVVTVDSKTGVAAAAEMARQGLVDWSKRPELQAGDR